jgi:acyl carrier protein
MAALSLAAACTAGNDAGAVLAATGAWSYTTGVHDSSDMLAALRALLCGRLGIADQELQAQSTLEDLCIDSVELAFVFSYFERDTGFGFDDAEVDVARYGTVGALAELLADRVSRAAGGVRGGESERLTADS